MSEKNKQISISEKTYENLKKLYEEFLQNKDKIPPIIFEKIGNTFEDYVEYTLAEYCDTKNRIAKLEEKMKDVAGGFNLNDLQDALSKMNDIFEKKDDSKKSNEKDTNLSNDTTKVKN